MKTSTALTLAAAASLCTAAAFIQHRQKAHLPPTGPLAGIDEECKTETVPPKESEPQPSLAQANARSPFRVTGLLVQHELSMQSQFGSRMPFAGSQAKVRLAIEYSHDADDLIDWVHGDCQVTSFQDDRGHDLLDHDDVFGPFEMMPNFSKDHRQLAFVLQSKTGLSTDASSVHAEGTLVLRRASERTTESSQPVYLETDSHVVCGPFDMEVAETGKSQWSDGWEVTLETRSDLSGVIAWFFTGEDGERVEITPASSMSGMGYWSQSLTLPAAPNGKGILEIEHWKEVREETVPFRVEAGLGLSATSE